MVHHTDIRAGHGKIIFDMNTSWFIEMADAHGWVMIEECAAEFLDGMPNPEAYATDIANFWKLTETVIGNWMWHKMAKYQPMTLDEELWEVLENDPDWQPKFNNHFITKEQFEWIIHWKDEMSELNIGDILTVNDYYSSCLIEKLHDGRWGVKTLEDKATIREMAGDWFVSQFVVLIAEQKPPPYKREKTIKVRVRK